MSVSLYIFQWHTSLNITVAEVLLVLDIQKQIGTPI